MTQPTEKRWTRWGLPALLGALLLGGWLGGVALFMPGAGSQAREARATPRDTAGADADGDIPDAVLGSLGGLIGANLHQGYLNIGFLADGVEGKLYTREEGSSLLAAVSALIDTTEDQINKLPAENLQPDDQKHLDRFRVVLPPLKTQVKELRLYWSTDKQDHADRFQQARGEAQTALESLVRK